ncbi:MULTISPECIES: M48 family metallopeptidase [Chryseobacterium]|uniref:Peptidase n=1 Tax=Chryseobacterium bernardetii TaxID=1241978 RepID=A0A3G6U8Q9_9FLAO|nr:MULTISPECIES: M48 family metallopeptidase [Chryseobacterium]AZB27592.1 peptidase [Chryseobacterium bernardetii]AZB36429.1 peptidase [Chryseobacterium bernardetii]UCA58995.1 M48 family metallopeptidase [Chryseobacterium rhizoplanae]
MKKIIVCLIFLGAMNSMDAQKINLGKAAGIVSNGAKALTFTNEDAIKLSKESVDWMDKNNPVAGPKDPYTVRLNKLFGKHKSQDGLNLNYKVYKVKDINAFACADGSVRVFSSLMDIMTDNELLAVIGHEIGHVKNQDTKDAMKSAYLKAAALDAASSASGAVATLNDSQIGKMANAFLDASHSKKQESEADTYSYDFMKANKYDVVGAYTAFKKLALLSQGSTQSGFEKMFNSHPDSEKRAQSIKKRAEKDGLWKDPGTVAIPTTKLTK